MKIVLSKKRFIGMIALPVLFSCSTLDHDTHAIHNEQPKKVAAVPAPVATDDGKLIKITSSADTLFDFDSAELKPSSIRSLENIARNLQNIKNNFIVIGYTDRIGSENHNKKLSLRQTEAIKIYLISKGIDPSRIFTDGRGKSNPVTGNTCRENMKRKALIDCLSPDRRVEIEVVGIQDHDTHAIHNEQPKKVAAVHAPAATDDGKLIKITSSADALFYFDSAELKPSSIRSLENIARNLQNTQNDPIVIGYTDRIGSENYNKKLSLRRAETVKIYLISKGIDPSRIFTEGRGESDPVTGNTCGENMKRKALIDCLSPDRRVKVKMVDD